MRRKKKKKMLITVCMAVMCIVMAALAFLSYKELNKKMASQSQEQETMAVDESSEFAGVQSTTTIGRITNSLEAASGTLERIPTWAFMSIIVLCLGILCGCFIIVPKCRMEEDDKEKYKKYGVYSLLGLYLCVILLITFFDQKTGAHPSGNGMIENIFSFFLWIPAGMLMIWRNRGKRSILKGLALVFAFSLGVEGFRIVVRSGVFDLSKLIFHVIGGAFGILIIGFWRFTHRRKKVIGLLLRTMMVFMGILVLGMGGLFGIYHVLRVNGEKGIEANISTAALQIEPKDKEKTYRLNEKVHTILWIMTEEKAPEEKTDGNTSHADTIFLLVMDQSQNKMKMISINKDVMTEIPTLNKNGTQIGEEIDHLGRAYELGDGKEKSCQYMVDAVSKLFYGIPINGYVAFDMEFMKKANDAVGGVSVTVPEDLTVVDPILKNGANVTLNGEQALKFLQWNDETQEDGNSLQNARQKQYLSSFFSQTVQAVKKDVTLPLTLYKDLSDRMITNIGTDNMTYLITKVINMSFAQDNMMLLQGETRHRKDGKEVYVDEDALYELILDTFYIEEKIDRAQENQ